MDFTKPFDTWRIKFNMQQRIIFLWLRIYMMLQTVTAWPEFRRDNHCCQVSLTPSLHEFLNGTPIFISVVWWGGTWSVVLGLWWKVLSGRLRGSRWRGSTGKAVCLSHVKAVKQQKQVAVTSVNSQSCLESQSHLNFTGDQKQTSSLMKWSCKCRSISRTERQWSCVSMSIYNK